MQFNWRIFVVAFIFSLVVGVLSGISQFLFEVFMWSMEVYTWVNFGISVVAFVVSPLLLFACFYIMGKKIDFAAEFPSAVVPLFLGSWVGHLLGYFTLQLGLYSRYSGAFVEPLALWFSWYGFRMAFSFEFFAGFAALSMSYIAKKRPP